MGAVKHRSRRVRLVCECGHVIAHAAARRDGAGGWRVQLWRGDRDGVAWLPPGCPDEILRGEAPGPLPAACRCGRVWLGEHSDDELARQVAAALASGGRSIPLALDQSPADLERRSRRDVEALAAMFAMERLNRRSRRRAPGLPESAGDVVELLGPVLARYPAS